MTTPTRRNSATVPQSSHGAVGLTRREWLAAAGVGTAALLPQQGRLRAEAPPDVTPGAQPGTVVFANTTVANSDSVRNDVALAVAGDRIAAIGPTDEVLEQYRQAEVYDGRGKALFPGLINCHAHMRAVVARGFNEDFGFPNSAGLAISPGSLLEGEESALMVQVAALEAIRTGTTTIVEYTGNIQRHAAVLADTGLRCVLAEGIRDSGNVPGPMSSTGLAGSEAPRFSARLRDEGLQRINDLYSSWHGARQGRISVFPAAALTETSSPELLQAVRAFAETHDLGYTIHLNQSRPEFEFMVKHHGLRPAEYLDRHDFLGPRLFAAHARYVNDEEIALLGSSGTIISHQAAMAANRGVSPPIPALRAAGCPIALGTDNNTNDVFEVMRIALVTERIRRNRDGDEVPGLLPQPEDILADATQGGARAVQQDDVLGTLEVGKKADLLVVDTQRAHLVPAGRIVSALVHSGHPGDIESVMVDGRFVMRDREVLTMDEESIIREADAVGRRIWSRVLEAGPLSVPRLPRRAPEPPRQGTGGPRPRSHPRAAPFTLGCVLAAASLPLACGPISDSADAAGAVVETETIGDTTVVRTVSGSVWGEDVTLVPEVSIGELEGPEEYLIGSVQAIAVDDDRNVYILDGQARHVRVFDSAGTYVKTLGRAGEGPGEFEVPIGVAVSDGRVLVRDPANGRVQLFGLETGEAEEWRYQPSGVFMNTPLYQDDQGRVYVDITEEETRFIVMDSDGTQIDTISAPDAPADFDDGDYSMSAEGESGDRRISVGATVPFSPDWYWTVHPAGHFLSALSTAYRIHLEQDDGVLRIERNHTPVAVLDDERDRHEQRIVNRMRRFDPGWSWNGPVIPDHKPPFRGLSAGSDGRIWVRLWTEAERVANEEHDPANPESVPFTWVEPLRYDVFEADGTYLGAVVPPVGFSPSAPPVFGRSFVWAVERDDLGVERVRRYRLALPAS